MKRIVSVVALFALAAGLVLAGGTTEPAPTSATGDDTTIYNLTYYQTVSAYQPSYGPFDPSNTAYFKWIQDEFGVAITASERKDNADQELQLLWASGDLPNIFRVNDVWLQKLVGEDDLLSLDSIYADSKRYPNIAKIPEIYRVFGKYNGVQYSFFGGQSETPDRFDGEYSEWTMVIPTIYEQAGVTVKTYDDLKKFLQTVKDRGLTNVDNVKVYGLGGSTGYIARLFDRMYGLDTADVVMTANGKWVPAWATEERYQAMKALNEMWRAGYMDPEAFSQDAASVNKKIRNSLYAMFVGSYGEADAYFQNGSSMPNVDDQWTWFNTYGQQIINKISGSPKAIGTGYSVFPTSRTVLSAATPAGAAAKFADFVEWRYTEEGMFSDVYEGWPGETWKYDESGKAVPWYSWWPGDKDPKTAFLADADATKVSVTGPYWQILNRFQNCFGPTPVRLVMEKGTLRKVNIWWNWLRNITVPSLNETSQMATPIGVVPKTQKYNEIMANMTTKYDSWKAQVWTAASAADFEAKYASMIRELSRADVEGLTSEFAAGWNQAVANNPDLANLKFPKQATPIAQVKNMIK